MIQVFGHRAAKGVVEVDEEQLAALLSGERLSADLPVDKGYVILKLKGNGILGLGFFINGAVISQISSRELKKEMLAY